MIKLTTKRKKVYDCIKQSSNPLSALMISDILADSDINLSTIYRAIDFLEDNNLLLRFHFNNTSFYFINQKHHSHYFICTNCLYIKQFECNLKDTIKRLTEHDGLKVENHEATIYGLCNKCH